MKSYLYLIRINRYRSVHMSRYAPPRGVTLIKRSLKVGRSAELLDADGAINMGQ